MNDDLEERLARLRPAALPRDLMRNLRAAEPSRRVGRPGWTERLSGRPGFWPMACAGTAATVALALVLSRMIPTHPTDASSQTVARSGGGVAMGQSSFPSTGDSAIPLRSVAFDAGELAPLDETGLPTENGGANSGRRYALLTGLVIRPVAALHLEMPTGPMRLNGGYELFDHPSHDHLSGSFDFRSGEPF